MHIIWLHECHHPFASRNVAHLADCKVLGVSFQEQLWYLNGFVSNPNMVDDTPLDRKCWKAFGSSSLGERIQAGVCIAIICLPCKVLRWQSVRYSERVGSTFAADLHMH